MARHYSVTSPMRRPRYIYVRKFLFVFSIVKIKRISVQYFMALRRGPCPYTAALRAGLKISVAFLGKYFFNESLYAHLPLQLLPEKNNSHLWHFVYFLTLGAVIIG